MYLRSTPPLTGKPFFGLGQDAGQRSFQPVIALLVSSAGLGCCCGQMPEGNPQSRGVEEEQKSLTIASESGAILLLPNKQTFWFGGATSVPLWWFSPAAWELTLEPLLRQLLCLPLWSPNTGSSDPDLPSLTTPPTSAVVENESLGSSRALPTA